MVLDGSIIPVSPRPNPALTITALCERAMEHILEQLKIQDDVTAEEIAKTGKK
jgi:choline dehydrogenase-like flavoprotein